MQNENLNLKSNLKYRVYQFSLEIIKLIASLPEKKIFWILDDQLLRSATSIGANIVEAQASSSRREFIKFFEIALKSSNETKYWLCLLRDSGLIEKDTVEKLLNEVTEISKMIGASVLTLKGKKKFEF